MKVMNTEEQIAHLLKPRYKVIADYPRSPYVIGNIISDDDKEYTCEYMSRFPAIFKLLEWWEDREESDMPKYLKWQNNGKVREVEKYRKWFEALEVTFKGGRTRTMSAKWTPCTEEEYNQQSK
jgi:hypothetical protein